MIAEPFAGVGLDLSRPEISEALSDEQRLVAAMVAHGTHMEALAWGISRAGPGAILEVGSGWNSTPILHGWAASSGRWLCTIETEVAWGAELSRLYPEDFHQFWVQPRGAIRLPSESFALALVDGINEDRAGWLRRLAETRALVVVHDVERSRDEEMPGVAAALSLFNHRVDFRRLFPHTAVVWNP